MATAARFAAVTRLGPLGNSIAVAVAGFAGAAIGIVSRGKLTLFGECSKRDFRGKRAVEVSLVKDRIRDNVAFRTGNLGVALCLEVSSVRAHAGCGNLGVAVRVEGRRRLGNRIPSASWIPVAGCAFARVLGFLFLEFKATRQEKSTARERE